jgi:hypothetical protein
VLPLTDAVPLIRLHNRETLQLCLLYVSPFLSHFICTMANLPAEIWLSVAELLSPDDAFHFATVNNEMWQLCDSLITTH